MNKKINIFLCILLMLVLCFQHASYAFAAEEEILDEELIDDYQNNADYVNEEEPVEEVNDSGIIDGAKDLSADTFSDDFTDSDSVQIQN